MLKRKHGYRLDPKLGGKHDSENANANGLK